VPRIASLPLAALAGVLTRLAFPDPGWWPLAVVGVALWTISLAGRSARAGAVLGLVYGLAFFAPLLHWSGVYVGVVPWLALAVLQALYLALLGAVVAPVLRAAGPGAAGGPGRLWARRPVPALLATSAVTAALWVGQEALRDRTPFGGFPWGRLAFAQADAPFAPLAALGGAPLVTFAVAWCGALLGLAALAALPAPIPRGRTGRTVLPALAVAAACAASGLLVPLPTAGDPVRVAGIQGDVPEAGLEFNAERRAVLDNHAGATVQLADRVRSGAAQRPDVVIWPENASDLDPYREADARAVIDAAVDAVGVPVLVGAVLAEPADRLTNASIVWTPGSGPGERYAKRHPVPFGEYIPYRSFFRTLSSKVDLVQRDFAAGSRVGTLNLGAVRAGVSICFEVAYDDLVRDTVRDGADLLVVQTNNATFGYTDEAVQQLAMSRLRALEHGRAVAHVSTVGVSALISPDGSQLTRSGLFTPAVLEATLPRRSALTPADRVGSWPEAVLTAAGLLGALALLLGSRTARRRTGPLESSPSDARDEAARVLTEAG
jgi:apolipoprotein N-acyltransferase